ncbi:MAG: creatininase family protein [Nitrospirae bacterium]|nr:creatininase family protein [Nitrospirota bacterium]MBF0592696.1 creatininase family protein [Nitrospirota bacterium]
MLLEEITMQEFEEHLQQCKTIIFPFGTVEEHGNHLPLFTDTLIANEVLRRVIQQRDVFLAPPLHYGVCTTTRQHPGTISIMPETLRMLTRDIVVDSYRKGLRNFMLLSGHGGGIHMSAMKEVAEILIDELDNIQIIVASPYDILHKELSQLCETPGDSHAGELETSIVMALRPGLVKGTAEEGYPQFPSPFIVRDKLKYWPHGIWGNPQKATSDKGQAAIDIIVSKVVELIDRLDEGAGLSLRLSPVSAQLP